MKRLVLVLTVAMSSIVHAQSNEQIRPRANETLRDFEARMEAYFAPQIAERGIKALVEEEGSEYNEYQKFLLFWTPRLGPTGDFGLFFRQEAMQFGSGPRRRAVRSDDNTLASNGAVVNDVPWQEIGPIERPSGSGSARGIGPTEFLTFYAPGPSRMLTGATSGGLFFSRDSGVTWLRSGTDTKIGRSGVSSAVFHPGNPQTWFAASSGNSTDNDAMWIGPTGGIFRTTDEGATWKQIATQAELGGIWTKIFQLSIHPADGNQLWAATSNGIYASSNAMTTSPTWNLVAFGGESVFDFELRPGNPQWRYATVASYGNNGLTNWRFMYTSDGGTTWQPVPNQPASTVSANGLTIEVTPAKADNLYCVTMFASSATLAIYNFGAGAWATVTSNAFIDMGGGKGFAVDPFNPNEIFLTQGTEGRRYDAANGTFIQFNSNYSSNGTYHPDIEDFVPHPVSPNEVWMCHHGGIARSVDNGVTWSDRSTGLGVAQPLRFGTSPTDPRYVAMGTYHDGTNLTDSPWFELWSPSWRLLVGGDGLVPLINPATAQFMWVTHQLGSWYRSSDYGQTFSQTPPDSPHWVVDGAFDVPSPTTQYRIVAASAGVAVHRSFDNGTTWTGISQFHTQWPQTGGAEYTLWRVYTPETSSGTVLVHLLERPNQNVWWRSHLYRTTIATNPNAASVAASWTELPLPADLWTSDIEFDPADPNIVYIANSSSINMGFGTFGMKMVIRVDYTNPFASTLYQCNAPACEDLTQNLPNGTTGGDSLAIETTGGGLYYVCDYGAYYSTAATRAVGQGWNKVGSGLPHTPYQGLELNLVNHKVRVASMGRGVWEHDMVAAVEGMKFDDVNDNGQRDPGEPGLANWTIRIIDALGNVTATTTNADGEYTFTMLPAGDYVLDEVAQNGWTQKFPSAGTHTVHVDAGQRMTGLDFGNRLASATSCITPPAAMAAWWGLDFASGVTHDMAGSDNAGTVNGGATITPGHVINSMHFNGSTQFVDVPSHADLQLGTSDLTIDAWVRTTKTGVRPIVDKRGGALFGYTLFLLDGRLGFQMADRAGSTVCSSSTTSACTNYIAPSGSVNVADGLAHHVAVTVDRDSTTGGRLWVDGAIVLTFDPTIRNQSLDTTANLLIGKRSTVSSAVYWDGDLDEIEIFKRALPAAEIQSMVKAGRNGKCRCNPNCL